MLVKKLAALLLALSFLTASPVPVSAQQVVMGGVYIPSLKSADFNSTADQAITIPWVRYVLRRIVVDNCSVSVSVAAGGFYTGASKTGTIIVSAAETYVVLTSAQKFKEAVLTPIVTTDVLTAGTIYLSLTVAQGSAVTCDVRVFGDPLP